jgi:hypothetical protein
LKVILEVRPEQSEMLFDLSTDPGETVNLQSTFPDKSKALAEEVWELLGGEEALRMEGYTDPMEGLDAETLEALRALGYVGVSGQKKEHE